MSNETPRAVPTQQERLVAVLSKPTFIDEVYTCVSNGGTLIDLCELWDVPYGRIMKFIRSDNEVSKIYDQALADRAEWAREQILAEVRLIALADARNAFDDKGNVKPVDQWPKVLARNVSALEVVEEFEGSGQNRTWTGYSKRIKFNDKLKALELLMKNSKLLNEEKQADNVVRLDELLGLARSLPEKPKSNV